MSSIELKRTPLYALHQELGARLVPFAGYAMPVQYSAGIRQEHLHTRTQAGLFDVSHMGQFLVSGNNAAVALERLISVDLESLENNHQRYGLLTNAKGGIIDDLIISRWHKDVFYLVVNAACKEQDLCHLRQHLNGPVIKVLEDQALLALQGPAAKNIMEQLAKNSVDLLFMESLTVNIVGVECVVSRSGYTGEDGFEISVPAAQAETLARLLLSFTEVEAIGLGARDTLRLEAGLCLYGHDMDVNTTPVEAGLGWSIGHSRRLGGNKAGGFLGAEIIIKQLEEGVTEQQRVGLLVDGRQLIRAGEELFNEYDEGVGRVSSGSFSPSLKVPIAMAYVRSAWAKPGTKLHAVIRGKPVALSVTAMPFIQPRYFKGKMTAAILAQKNLSELEANDEFLQRHIGPDTAEQAAMLAEIDCDDMQSLLAQVVPESIRLTQVLTLEGSKTEQQALTELANIASKNKTHKSFIGQGYYDSISPRVILRNVLENPAWYTAYTPYQSEISQGRLEALFNFQTLVCDLTGMAIANASMLDEATAAAEAMSLCKRLSRSASQRFFVDQDCLPQTIEVVRTRAESIGFEVIIGDPLTELSEAFNKHELFGILLQYPGVSGQVNDFRGVITLAHENKALVVMAADILSLLLLESPGALEADVAIGSTQRFGVPLGFGGPHAAYFATRENYKRSLPGRLVGLSKDSHGQPAYRLALQTREQHIRREKATSNICTAQVLLAVIAGMYAVYHGAEGLRRIAERVHLLTTILAQGLRQSGLEVLNSSWFDTLTIKTGGSTKAIHEIALQRGFNLRHIDKVHLGISLDETTSKEDVLKLLNIVRVEVGGEHAPEEDILSLASFVAEAPDVLPEALMRTDTILTQSVFKQYHSETQMLRYLRRLADKDIALDRAMIPLGSCTMKLNATAEMLPISWPEFADIHPFVPPDQVAGYHFLIEDLEVMLCAITGYAEFSLQPNAGSQGEYAGLLAIRAYHKSRNDEQRNICLIPTSAHGTNPASAHMCGMTVVSVKCDKKGNVDVDDLRNKAEENSNRLSAIMVTYPSTHGVFEEEIRTVCEIVHSHGGQVYLDGANMNAMVGLCKPGEFGGDVSHLNLHKTFCIPHGGGGPGVGPIGVAAHLAPFLPKESLNILDTKRHGPLVAAAPWGSAGILPIAWMYIRMMGAQGLQRASEVAILNANYIATRLAAYYPILYKGEQGRVAHECIIDIRPFEASSGVSVEDVAKRLIDYGFHAPTMSFPVAGTLMIEPTESECRAELDRFCEAMISIKQEIEDIINGKTSMTDNPLSNAPHTAQVLSCEHWDKPYSRQEAVFPACPDNKYWPPVGRVDNVFGDKNLIGIHK